MLNQLPAPLNLAAEGVMLRVFFIQSSTLVRRAAEAHTALRLPACRCELRDTSEIVFADFTRRDLLEEGRDCVSRCSTQLLGSFRRRVAGARLRRRDSN